MGLGIRQLLTVLRRAEIIATAEWFGEYRDRWKTLQRGGRRRVQLPPEFWEYPGIPGSEPDMVSSPKVFPHEGQVVRENDNHYAFGVHLPRKEVRRIWPTSPSPDLKSSRGRPRKTGYADMDEPLMADILRLIETKECTSPTQAAWKVVGRDGKGAHGNGTP